MKVWVAALNCEYNSECKFELFTNQMDAMTCAADMMIEIYGKPGDACEGHDPVRYLTIPDYGGTVGLTKIVFVRNPDDFFPGDPDVSIYEKEVK